jgi:cell division protein FtsL
MDCIECKTANPDSNRFCSQCGAELGRTLDETVRKKGFRDRQATEAEITEAVVERLMKWGRWLGGIAAVILAFIAFAVSLVYRDTRAVLDAGKTQIESAVAEAKNNINAAVEEATQDIGEVRRHSNDLGKQVNQLRLDINGYKEVNSEMQKLQQQFHGQTANLENLDLRVHSLETVGSPAEPGEGTQIGFKNVGCKPSHLLRDESKVWYCVQGSPLILYQRTPGDLRPVSSLSSVGFQDISTGPTPACTAASRGTFYVEKTDRDPDRPLLCVKKSDSAYGWIQLGTP